jgi:hypothetical protein
VTLLLFNSLVAIVNRLATSYTLLRLPVQGDIRLQDRMPADTVLEAAIRQLTGEVESLRDRGLMPEVLGQAAEERPEKTPAGGAPALVAPDTGTLTPPLDTTLLIPSSSTPPPPPGPPREGQGSQAAGPSGQSGRQMPAWVLAVPKGKGRLEELPMPSPAPREPKGDKGKGKEPIRDTRPSRGISPKAKEDRGRKTSPFPTRKGTPPPSRKMYQLSTGETHSEH